MFKITSVVMDILKISCVVLLLAEVAVTSSDLIVNAPCGQMKGVELTDPQGESYVGFQRIPYALPPVGDLRFEKPKEFPVFDTIFDASEPIKNCPQPQGLGRADGIEDCLHLNVFAKELPKDSSTKKKVMMWIHGGGFFVGGAGLYIPGSFVISQDVIVVTINYRVGTIGFLSTEDEVIPGNNGLWDMLMALKWVRTNIEAFGGDINDITIAGESAGGAAVGALCVSPFTKGLFSKAYLMSGSMTSMFALSLGAREHALILASEIGCYEGDPQKKLSKEESEKLLKCLKKLPLKDFMWFNNFYIFTKTQFVPRVDGVFLPAHPQVLLNDEKYLKSIGFYDRTYLVGIANREVSLNHNYLKLIEHDIETMEDKTDEEKAQILEETYDESRQYYISARLRLPEKPSEALVAKVKDWYDRREEAEMSLSDLTTDLCFLMPAYDYLDAMARSKSTNVYFFLFNHFPAFMKGQYKGISHGGDLSFWFDFKQKMVEKVLHVGIVGEMDEDDFRLKTVFSNLVGQFIKTGNPWNGIKDKLPGGWPIYDTQGSNYLDFGLQPSIKTHLHSEKYDLWKNLVPKWASSTEGRDEL